MFSFIEDLCRPSKYLLYFTLVYFFLTLPFMIAFKEYWKLSSMIWSILSSVFWIWFLNKLCDWGYTTTAWVILFVKLFTIFILFTILGVGLNQAAKKAQKAQTDEKKTAATPPKK